MLVLVTFVMVSVRSLVVVVPRMLVSATIFVCPMMVRTERAMKCDVYRRQQHEASQPQKGRERGAKALMTVSGMPKGHDPERYRFPTE